MSSSDIAPLSEHSSFTTGVRTRQCPFAPLHKCCVAAALVWQALSMPQQPNQVSKVSGS